jgi:LuxR family maltose regulon positive regulatory protein
MTIAPGTAVHSELVLKTTPPRAPRHLLLRERLSLDNEQFRDRTVVVVQAPAGFGKTSLLAQWRREFLAKGAAVAWMSADSRDDPQRFLHSLVMAIRGGCGRPGFGRLLLDAADVSAGELEGVTAWLAEVAQTSLDIVLIVDEGERLAEGCATALAYLLHNAPPNLRFVVAGRSGLDAPVADLVAYGECFAIGAETLRFRLDETMALVRNRFGTKVDADACARLHEVTEGWPLGLQLALAAVELGADPRGAIDAFAARTGAQKDQLIGSLLAKLAPDDTDFLVRISAVDLLHPDLCVALTGAAGDAERLARLSRDTPIFVVGDDSEWSRLHNLARDALRVRLAELPRPALAQLHARAMRWLADHGMLQDAARHAHAAGEHAAAYDLAEQCLYDATMQGQFATVLEWVELLPEAELDRRPRLRLAAAWVLALSERHLEAERLVARILEDPAIDTLLRYECALIGSVAAYYGDDPDRCVALFEPWAAPPQTRDPRLLQMHANRLSVMALLRGDPAQARRCQQQAPRGDFGKAHAFVARWGDFVVGLSYLWEGQAQMGEAVLQPALASADAQLGRRHPLACMIAALLAAAAYERDRVEEAGALLANRLDVLERAGTPETALLGYRTAARVAAVQGAEHRALDLLETLHAAGVARRLPRICVSALAEQVRMHAARFRSETCRALVVRIDELLASADLPQGPLWRRAVDMQRVLAHAYAAIAAQDWRQALDILERAAPLAEAIKLGRLRIEIMALRAFALDHNGDRSGRPLLQEAMNLAQTFGLARTFVDAHPAIADWARRIGEEAARAGSLAAPVPVAKIQRPATERDGAGPRAIPSMVLTPKEREVLELLARNMSNKEIAQAMAVGEETVKWHLKNLFGKLDAGTRKHAVRRAHLLGLLEGGD